MGWTGTEGKGTHAEIDAHLMRGFTRQDGTVITMTDCRLVSFGRHYHVVRENGDPKLIIVTLITRYRPSKAKAARGEFGGETGEWVYKDMSEDMHPYYYDCPLDLLDMVPVPDSDGARAWREGVKAHHAGKAALKALPIEVGTRVRLKDGLKIGTEDVGGICATVVGFHGRQRVPLVNLDTGLYARAQIRAPRKLIAALLPAERVKS